MVELGDWANLILHNPSTVKSQIPVHAFIEILPALLCGPFLYVNAHEAAIMSLSPTGLCSFCDSFDIRMSVEHDCFFTGYRCDDVVKGALDGCSFCCFVLDILVAPQNGTGTMSQFWLGRIRRQQRQQAGKPSSSVGEVLGNFWDRYVCRGSWIDPWVRFTYDPSENPESVGMGITGMTMGVDWFGKRSTAVANFNVAADADTPAWVTGDIRGEIIEPLSLSAERIGEIITSWHMVCTANHPSCNKTLSRLKQIDLDNNLPSRCIEVQRVDMPESPTHGGLRFYLRETKDQSGRYLALTHRWGPATSLCRTTMKNYNSRIRNGLYPPDSNLLNTEVDTMSQLFADTCTLALSLGITYVWIDTLCIIQDDADDWDSECVKMATYYQRAWVTIAATRTTTNPTGGLFYTLEAEEVPRVSRLPYRNEKGERDGFFYVQHLERGTVQDHFATQIAESELRQRAWVLQESLLSPRVVSFCDIGVFLECRTERPRLGASLAVREVIHESHFFNENTNDPVLLLRSSPVPVRESLSAYRTQVLDWGERFYWNWYNLVRRYSPLDLTKIHQDRLVALAGMASEFGQAIAAEEKAREEQRLPDSNVEERRDSRPDGISTGYASGLWLNDIWNGFLWEQAEPGRRVRAQALPTWSWASMLTLKTNSKGEEELTGMRVEWQLGNHWEPLINRIAHPLANIEDAVVIPVTTDAQGHHRARFDLPTTDFRPLRMANDEDQQYTNSSRFVALALRGKLLRVDSINDMGEDKKRWASPPRGGSNILCGRHRISCNDCNLTGWASFEHPDYQPSCSYDHPTYAFIIGHEKPKSDLKILFKLYLVLYVREVETAELFAPSYERVGVGQVWGWRLIESVSSVKEERIWLV
ncbi:heterokaryon incompatibility protein-domain-containing protein [Xylaria scruposa]|nr:heterokaryon incompatibility protein-domain-containing protein [Xylaria scruposa]